MLGGIAAALRGFFFAMVLVLASQHGRAEGNPPRHRLRRQFDPFRGHSIALFALS